jgi:hypothetical protein
MRIITSISKYLLLTGIACAMVVSVNAQQMTQASAKVVRIKGAARYANANNVWQPLKVGDVLQAGSIVETAEGSRVDLVLGVKNAGGGSAIGGGGAGSGAGMSHQSKVDQDFVRITENATMGIDKLLVADTGTDKISETQLDLRKGRIFGTVKKLSAGSKYEIKIPNGVAGIRGTVYTISADGILSVLSGTVVIAYVDASGNTLTQAVAAGQQFDISTGKITTLSDSEKQGLQNALNASRTGLPPGLQHFPEDHTNHYISPTQGHPGFQVVPN